MPFAFGGELISRVEGPVCKVPRKKMHPVLATTRTWTDVKEFNMRNAKLDSRESILRRELRKIRSIWSPDEHRRRAEEGRRRTAKLFHIIVSGAYEPEVMAVGAPASEDVRRLFG
jgi:hypothetical protein